MASVLKPNSIEPREAERASGFAGVAGFNLDDFAAAGVRHLKGVEQEAARILAAAKTEAAMLKKQAHQTGLAEGLAAAEKEVDKKIKSAVNAELAGHLPMLASLIQQLDETEKKFLDEFRDCLIGTALAASERIVLAKLEREPEVLQRWAEVAVESARMARRITIAVHPETLAEHGERLEAILSMPGLPEETRIDPDETIEPAGIVVRCDGGAVEMTLSRQLERLDEMLRV